MRTVEFWYEFASTYSYLSAMRIDERASRAGIAVVWRPFLLRPIFAAQGWTTSPFNLYPAKGRNMWRDMEREAAALGLPLTRPDPFPQNSLLAARVALVGETETWGPAYSKAVFRSGFADGRVISDAGVVSALLDGLGLDARSILARAGSPGIKDRLRARTEEAVARGIFGAPSFVTADGELFWGNDRLERALDWAAKS